MPISRLQVGTHLWLALAMAGCNSAQAPAAAERVASFRELLDSLSSAGGCPRTDLPRIDQPAWSRRLSHTDACGAVTAALRRLGKGPAVEPYLAPADTARVARATVSWMLDIKMDATGSALGAPNSIARVELDVPGRPKLIWAQYQLGTEREAFGAVHR